MRFLKFIKYIIFKKNRIHFLEYIKIFIKIKQESSEIPKDYIKEQCINLYKILLDNNKIEKNPGRAKLCLNSLYFYQIVLIQTGINCVKMYMNINGIILNI